MPLGIDANGRSLRTYRDGTASDPSRFAVVGVPPAFPDEGFVWNNRLAADPTLPFRSVPLEHAWGRIAHLDPKGAPRPDALEWTYADGKKGRLHPADAIADAVIQNADVLGMADLTVLAVPNHLDETGQDQILEAFQAHGVFSIRLLWRPVALAMDWANRNPFESAAFPGRGLKLCVVDLEGRGLEVTLLEWRAHDRERSHICPVRSYPRRTNYDCEWMSWQWAMHIASTICGTSGDPDSLLWGPSGDDLQGRLEGESAQELLCQQKADHRRWMECEMRQPEAAVTSTWADTVACSLPQTLGPSDVILLHGWPSRYVCAALERKVALKVICSNPGAVARGAWLFADRLSRGKPTYYDTLPQYTIWVGSKDAAGNRAFDWKPLNEAGKVIDAGESWKLSAQNKPELVALRNGGLRLARYIDRFSLLIQNRTVFVEDTAESKDANNLLAKRLAVDLPTMTREEKPLGLDVVIQPGSGHARFTIRGMDTDPLFGDLNEVELSWKAADEEPEHKGYIEAREVVGRIMDKPEYREMARLVTRRLRGENLTGQERALVQKTIVAFAGVPLELAAANLNTVLQLVLEPKGATDNLGNQVPTRGLWGSRRIPNDPDLDGIAAEMGTALLVRAEKAHWNHGHYYNHLNYMFVYTPRAFTERVRQEFTLGHGAAHVQFFGQVFAAGRVLATPPEFEAFLAFTLRYGFSVANLRAKYWWSVFRCLCYHKATANVDCELVRAFLEKLCAYFEAGPLPIVDERKFALHALLFCLRMREPGRGDPGSAHKPPFLPKGDGLRDRFSMLIKHGPLAGQVYPPAMLAGMPNLVQPGDDFSKYVWRFLNEQDTLLDREMGSGLATS